MKIEGLRSCHDQVGGIVYFGRLLDKIRLNSQGKLPAEYVENLGPTHSGVFDARCLTFLNLDYAALTKRTLTGGADEEILQWAFQNGRKPADHEIEVWNGFMRKRGWNDEGTERLNLRKKENGLVDRDDIQTFFDFIDADEGHPVRPLIK
jgi:gluconokinase